MDYKKMNEYKNILLNKYGKKCGYCKCELGVTSPIQIDNYRPKRSHPDLADKIENKVLCCTQCNYIKMDKDPIESDGKILILYPYSKEYDTEIKCGEDGNLVGVTEAAKSTIENLNLNRAEMVEYRRNNVGKFVQEVLDDSNNSYEGFDKAVNNIKSLLKVKELDKTSQEYYYRLLYANIITTMETYLAKVFVSQVLEDDNNKWRFIEKNKDWEKDKISYCDLKSAYENIDIKVQTALSELLYHNLPKVRVLYKEILSIEIFDQKEDMIFLCRAVDVRHDIVHRNGRKGAISKNKEEFHEINDESIMELIEVVSRVVKTIEQKKSKEM